MVAQFASKHPVGAMVLLSAFTSIAEVAEYGGGVSLLGMIAGSLVHDCFRSVDHLAQVQCPVLLLHGKVPQAGPLTHSRLTAAAGGQNCSIGT